MKHVPPSVCAPNNRPEVVLTLTVFDHTWTMRTERTAICTIVMGRRIETAAGIGWTEFLPRVSPSIVNDASWSQLAAHNNNTVLLHLRYQSNYISYATRAQPASTHGSSLLVIRPLAERPDFEYMQPRVAPGTIPAAHVARMTDSVSEEPNRDLRGFRRKFFFKCSGV
jgi:hypothetical protein